MKVDLPQPRVFAILSDPYRPVACQTSPECIRQFERDHQTILQAVPAGLIEMDGDAEAVSPTDGHTPTGQIFEYWFGFDPELRLMLLIQSPGEPWQLLELGRAATSIYEFDQYELARIALWEAGWKLVFDLDQADRNANP
ncbi:hypothetical protein [Hyphomonas sp.]|uniref:hypothetical protein n=1 Tax=Hyphomonas sp. TaxID=87 RepID=UPI0035277252